MTFTQQPRKKQIDMNLSVKQKQLNCNMHCELRSIQKMSYVSFSEGSGHTEQWHQTDPECAVAFWDLV